VVGRGDVAVRWYLAGNILFRVYVNANLTVY
jgi:hypothetical protein